MADMIAMLAGLGQAAPTPIGADQLQKDLADIAKYSLADAKAFLALLNETKASFVPAEWDALVKGVNARIAELSGGSSYGDKPFYKQPLYWVAVAALVYVYRKPIMRALTGSEEQTA